jgi:hypothetical protein
VIAANSVILNGKIVKDSEATSGASYIQFGDAHERFLNGVFGSES